MNRARTRRCRAADRQRPEARRHARPSRWTAGRIAALVIGALLVLFSLALLGAGGTALWADRTQRDAGYVTTDVHEFSTSGSALATESTELGSAGVGWLYSPGLLGKVRIRVTPASSGSPLFVGSAARRDVDRYLAGVNHTVISDFWGQGGGRRRRPARIRSRNAGLLGRLRHRLRGPDPGVGPDRRVVDRRGDECRMGDPGSTWGRTWEPACRPCCGSPSACWRQGRSSWPAGRS